jgi:hypothetical protein
MSTKRTTKTSSARRSEPHTAPLWTQPGVTRTAAGAGPAGDKLVKVNSAQINTIRQRYQASAAQRARRERREKPKPAPAKHPARVRALHAVELEFRKLAVEVGIERAKALVAEVEQGIGALVSR